MSSGRDAEHHEKAQNKISQGNYENYKAFKGSKFKFNSTSMEHVGSQQNVV